MLLTEPARLPPSALRMAVLDCVHARRDRDETQEALWREAPELVGPIFDAIFRRVQDNLACPVDGRHGLLAERMRELRQPLLSRPKRGLTVREMAERAGVDRETMACALQHHGYLELVPFGGPNRRRLVTRAAEKAELGHNPDGSRNHVARLEGMNVSSAFPVFYDEHFEAILWTLDFDGIGSKAAAITNKRARLRWLLENHDYLPNKAIAGFAGCTCRAVEKALSRETTKVRSHVIGAPNKLLT